MATFAELPDRVNQGDSLNVVDADGATWRGHLLQMTPDQLVLRAGRPSGPDVTVVRDRVRQVGMIGDPIGNGTLIGFGIGAAIGVVLRAAVWTDVGTSPVVYAAFGGAAGAGIGALTDAVVRREVIVFRAQQLSVGLEADQPDRRLAVVVRW